MYSYLGIKQPKSTRVIGPYRKPTRCHLSAKDLPVKVPVMSVLFKCN